MVTCTAHAMDRYVGGSSKIQTLSQDLSSIEIEVHSDEESQIIKVGFLHLQMCRYITN